MTYSSERDNYGYPHREGKDRGMREREGEL